MKRLPQLSNHLAMGFLLLFCGDGWAISPAARPTFVTTGHTFGQFNTSGSLGDLDGDGDLDAFLGAYVAPATAWLNDGRGQFTENGQTLELVLGHNVMIGDFDGVTGQDAFVVSHSLGTRLWHNDGAGQFVGSPSSLGSSGSAGSAAGDLDNDGDLDLMLASVTGHINAVAVNDGKGNFTFRPNGPHLAARSIGLGDLDGDGDLDAILGQATSNAAAPDRVLFNDGDGTFVDSGQSLGNQFNRDIGLADFDGDGDLDAFVANAGFFNADGTDTVWFNDGQGTFTDSGQALGNAKTLDLQLGDVDSDGDIDAVVLNQSTPDRVWLNDGSGRFSDWVTLPEGPNQPTRYLLGDLDGDQDDDLLALASNGNYVLENRTRRVLRGPSDLLGSGNPDLNVATVPEPSGGMLIVWAMLGISRFARGLACPPQ